MRKNAPYDQKTVIPAAAKRRAGVQKPLKCLDSRFRGNDDKSSSIASFRAVSEFFRTLLTAHRRGAVEAGRNRVERDWGPACRVHELFPALIEETLVVLRDVALGDETGIIRMRPRMPQPHRQVLGVPAPQAARARRS